MNMCQIKQKRPHRDTCKSNIRQSTKTNKEKTITQETKKMSNANSTKNPGMNAGGHEG